MNEGRNLLKEVLAIKGEEAQRAFIESLTQDERTELARQLFVAIDHICKTLTAFGEQIRAAFAQATEAMAAFGDVLRKSGLTK